MSWIPDGLIGDLQSDLLTLVERISISQVLSVVRNILLLDVVILDIRDIITLIIRRYDDNWLILPCDHGIKPSLVTFGGVYLDNIDLL